jgi:hypothetical protein
MMGDMRATFAEGNKTAISKLLELRRQAQKDKEPRVVLRIQGILLSLDGQTTGEIANHLKVHRSTLNEFTIVASVVTHTQFLNGNAIQGSALALRIAAGNVPNFVNLETGGYGATIQDALNSGQTPTMANFATLASAIAGCITMIRSDACGSLFYVATSPTGAYPKDTLSAIESIIRYPSYQADKVFGLLNYFYPVPQGKTLRPTPFMPYLTYSPNAWIFPLKFTGGGLSGPGKLMIDSEGNIWAGDNFIVGAQNQDALWAGNLSKFAPDGRPLSPMTTGFTGGASKASASEWLSIPTTTFGREPTEHRPS